MEQQSISLAGFNAFLSKVFMWMFVGLMLTGVTSVAVASSPSLLQLLYRNQLLFFALIIGEIVNGRFYTIDKKQNRMINFVND